MADLPVLADQETRQTPRGPSLPHASEEAFGSALARGARGLQRGLDEVAQAAENIDQRLDTASARELANSWGEYERELLYSVPSAPSVTGAPPPEGAVTDPNTPPGMARGYFQLRGRDALEARPEIEAALRRRATELAENARSGRARNAYEELVARRLSASLEAMDRHQGEQLNAYEDAINEASAREAHDNAVLLRNDPDQVNAYLNTIRQHADEMARRRGLDGEAAARMAQERVSAAQADVILAMADENPAMAEEVFQRWRGSMTAGDQGRVMEATRAVRLADHARREVDRLVQESGGDYRRAYALAENEPNTVLRDEIIQRLGQQAEQRETAERADALNAQERARSAIAAGRDPSGSDRALLMREGLWETTLNEFSSGRGSHNPTNDFLVRLSVDSPQAFNVVMRVIRNQPMPPGISEQEVDGMLRQATGAGVDEWRQRGRTIPSDDYERLTDRHEYLQGNRGTGDEGTTLTTRAYRDTWAAAVARAGQLGMSVSNREADAERVGQLRSFIYEGVADHVRLHNAAPTAEEMTAIVNEAFSRETHGRWNSLFDSRPADSPYAFQARGRGDGQSEVRVSIPFDRIPEDRKVEYARMWRQANPTRTITAGSEEEANFEAWVETQYAAYLMGR